MDHRKYNIAHPILLNWKKRISAVLQIGNFSIKIAEAFHRQFKLGAETLQREYELELAYNKLNVLYNW